MSSPRLPVALLSLSFLVGGPVLAQDDKETVPPEKVEEVVEARAEKERKEKESKPEGADPGESSYNIADCEAAWKGERDASDGSSGSGSDPEGAQDQMDDCENVKQ